MTYFWRKFSTGMRVPLGYATALAVITALGPRLHGWLTHRDQQSTTPVAG